MSPLASSQDNGFMAGQAMRRAKSKKMEKHANLMKIINMPLSPWSWIPLAPKAICLLTKVQGAIHNNISTPGDHVFFIIIGFTIHKRVAS